MSAVLRVKWCQLVRSFLASVFCLPARLAKGSCRCSDRRKAEIFRQPVPPVNTAHVFSSVLQNKSTCHWAAPKCRPTLWLPSLHLVFEIWCILQRSLFKNTVSSEDILDYFWVLGLYWYVPGRTEENDIKSDIDIVTKIRTRYPLLSYITHTLCPSNWHARWDPNGSRNFKSLHVNTRYLIWFVPL